MSSPFENTSQLNVENEARKTVDTSWDSPFHTLGKGATQAAPGNHKHEAGGEVGAHTHPGTDITSAVANATNATNATNADNADKVDGQHFSWSNPGTWPTYFWAVNSNGVAGFLVAGSRVPRVFTGATTPTGQKAGDIWAY